MESSDAYPVEFPLGMGGGHAAVAKVTCRRRRCRGQTSKEWRQKRKKRHRQNARTFKEPLAARPVRVDWALLAALAHAGARSGLDAEMVGVLVGAHLDALVCVVESSARLEDQVKKARFSDRVRVDEALFFQNTHNAGYAFSSRFFFSLYLNHLPPRKLSTARRRTSHRTRARA